MARALDLHSRGQGFDSLILHRKRRKKFLKKEEISLRKNGSVISRSDESIVMIYFHIGVYRYEIYFDVH